VGIALVIAGICLMIWMRSMLSLRVAVGLNGLLITERNGTRTILWDDIERWWNAHDRSVAISAGADQVFHPQTGSKAFTVHPRNGKEFGFEQNSIRGHIELGGMLKSETDRRSIPWLIEETHV